MKNRNRITAFTLIELLIVCAIISILASIAVVNYSEATVRSKVSAIQADMRTMATAVETYMADHNKYPIRHHRWKNPLAETNPTEFMVHHAPFTEKVLVVGSGGAAVGLHVMTTPIAYITTLPHDLFNLPAKAMSSISVYWSYG